MDIKEILELADKADITGKNKYQNNTYGTFSAENKAFLKAIPRAIELLKEQQETIDKLKEALEFIVHEGKVELKDGQDGTNYLKELAEEALKDV